MRIALLSPTAEPTPAAVGKLHFRQPLHAVFHHPTDFVLIEHRIAIKPLPLRGPLGIVANLLGVQIGRFSWIFFRSKPMSISTCCVMTVGKNRFSVCSVQPYG